MGDGTAAMSIKIWAPLVHDAIFKEAQADVSKWEIRDLFYDHGVCMLVSADHGYVFLISEVSSIIFKQDILRQLLTNHIV